MKIAIHNRKNSFSDRWIQYCIKNNIEYKIVNCYSNDIINQIYDCDAIMWHHNHLDLKDLIFAKQLMYSIWISGKKVFPDFYTNWHFDDKIGQKYLFEALNIPTIPTYIFYEKKIAIEWIKSQKYPIVFKLKSGAGSQNVKLIKSYNQALYYINRAFSYGYSQFSSIENLKERFRKFKDNKSNFISVIKGIARLIIKNEFSRNQIKEKNYIYFQEYIPKNDYDIRIIVIGEKAFGIKRYNRKNDFRASGSGYIDYNIENIPKEVIEIAFISAKKINSKCIAFDFLLKDQSTPLVLEISYGFAMKAYDDCIGYWDKNLNFIKEKFNPQDWMIESLF